jgi:hypothetical protein
MKKLSHFIFGVITADGSPTAISVNSPSYEDTLEEELARIGEKLDAIHQGKDNSVIILQEMVTNTMVYVPANVIRNSIITITEAEEGEEKAKYANPR